jgi:hypothetical protein
MYASGGGKAQEGEETFPGGAIVHGMTMLQHGDGTHVEVKAMEGVV